VRTRGAVWSRTELIVAAAARPPWARVPPLLRRSCAACMPGRPPAAGRWSGDGASGRAMPRIEPLARDGTVLCKPLSWRRKSVTDELGRFSMRERTSGGISTAAQAAATTSRTSSPIVSRPFVHDADPGHVRSRPGRMPRTTFHYDSTTFVTRAATLAVSMVTFAPSRFPAVRPRASAGLLPQRQLADRHAAVS
jgi:hypothetical protein